MRPVLNDEAAEILANVKNHITTISIVGKYRTGKSYFLNRLIGKMDGFPLGSTVKPKTKGLWIWFGAHPADQEHTLLLMDTEEFADPENSDYTDDMWIVSVVVLMSSTLVYNSVETIDLDSLNDLQLASDLTEHLKVKAGQNEDGTDFGKYIPTFIWAVRDFSWSQKLRGRCFTKWLPRALFRASERPQ